MVEILRGFLFAGHNFFFRYHTCTYFFAAPYLAPETQWRMGKIDISMYKKMDPFEIFAVGCYSGSDLVADGKIDISMH